MKILWSTSTLYFSIFFPLDMMSVNSILEKCLKLRTLYLEFSVVNSKESTEVMNTCVFTPLLY